MENDSSEEHNVTESTPTTVAPAPAAAEPVVESNTFEFTETTIMAALSYIGPLVIVPFLMKKNDMFVTFHVKQGLIVFGLELILYVIGGFMFHFVMPIITLVNLALVILSVIGILNTLQRKEKELPLVGSYASHIKL